MNILDIDEYNNLNLGTILSNNDVIIADGEPISD
jgi:hypothetical protein